MRIVCVEDDVGLRNVVIDTLQYLEPDARINVFASSDDLLSAFDSVDFDLVLLDVRIPGEMNGTALAKHLRDAGYAGVMALMSAFPRPPLDILEPIDCEWLSKPIDLDTLDGLIMKVYAQPPPN